MLPKKHRLNLKRSFSWVRSGSKWENDYLKLFYRYGQNSSPTLGISTSSAVFKNAHDRNRSRRIISSAVESLYPKLPGGINLLAMPKFKVLELSSVQLESQLEPFLNEINNSLAN